MCVWYLKLNSFSTCAVKDPCRAEFEWDCDRPYRNGNFEDLQTGQHGQQGKDHQWQQWQSALLRSVSVSEKKRPWGERLTKTQKEKDSFAWEFAFKFVCVGDGVLLTTWETGTAATGKKLLILCWMFSHTYCTVPTPPSVFQYVQNSTPTLHVTQTHRPEAPASSKFRGWGNERGSGSRCITWPLKQCQSVLNK